MEIELKASISCIKFKDTISNMIIFTQEGRILGEIFPSGLKRKLFKRRKMAASSMAPESAVSSTTVQVLVKHIYDFEPQ